jgi:hypothetical protein
VARFYSTARENQIPDCVCKRMARAHNRILRVPAIDGNANRVFINAQPIEFQSLLLQPLEEVMKGDDIVSVSVNRHPTTPLFPFR